MRTCKKRVGLMRANVLMHATKQKGGGGEDACHASRQSGEKAKEHARMHAKEQGDADRASAHARRERVGWGERA